MVEALAANKAAGLLLTSTQDLCPGIHQMCELGPVFQGITAAY